jgi:hypothetical protein
MRAALILLALAACPGNKNPKLTPQWKQTLLQIAPDCGGEELDEDGSYSCKGPTSRMLIMLEHGRLIHITAWIGTTDGPEAALQRVSALAVLVRPSVWAGVRAHIAEKTDPVGDSFREDGSPPERYRSGFAEHGSIAPPPNYDPMPTYYVSLSWDD